jgi:GlcNAc-P-P-Und epimerase
MDLFDIGNKKVLITGARGFLGKYIAQAFESSGFGLITLGKNPSNDLVFDLAKEEPLLDNYHFDRVIHAAGLAHKIPKKAEAVQAFYDNNLEGTENLLQSLISLAPGIRQFIYISTVAVYGRDAGELIAENTPLEARSPYALSKMHAEEQVINWGNEFGVPTLILRLPFVAGKDAPGDLSHLIQLMSSGSFRQIGQGNTRKSAVLAADVSRHLPLWENKDGIYNLTDSYHPSLAELYRFITGTLNLPRTKPIPDWIARILSGMGDMIPGFPYHSRMYYKLSSPLTFDDTKAKNDLGWNPTPIIQSNWLQN